MYFSNYGKIIEPIDELYKVRLSNLKKLTESDAESYLILLLKYKSFLNDRITDVFWERGELEVTLVERKSILYCHDAKRRREGWSEWVNLGLDDGKYKKKLAELVLEIKAAESLILS